MYKSKWLKRVFAIISFVVILSMVGFTIAIGF